ncbi:general stress protein CsbD [Roseivirga sp. BDSF3-8]|uniref:general stress protein CsbD n=1 Tax=Roseivirga sp. BDSF3-8 TaxID=3241598 RepID=UPI0035319136
MDNTKTDKKSEEFKMNGNWDKQSNQLKDKYPQLNDEDLKYHEGKENELIDRISTKLNKDRPEVVNILRKVQPAK